MKNQRRPLIELSKLKAISNLPYEVNQMYHWPSNKTSFEGRQNDKFERRGASPMERSEKEEEETFVFQQEDYENHMLNSIVEVEEEEESYIEISFDKDSFDEMTAIEMENSINRADEDEYSNEYLQIKSFKHWSDWSGQNNILFNRKPEG